MTWLVAVYSVAGERLMCTASHPAIAIRTSSMFVADPSVISTAPPNIVCAFSALRVRIRTVWPPSVSRFTTGRPNRPVAPMTRIRLNITQSFRSPRGTWAVVYPRLSTQSLKPSAAYFPRDLNDPVTSAPRLSNRAAILGNIPPTAVL